MADNPLIIIFGFSVFLLFLSAVIIHMYSKYMENIAVIIHMYSKYMENIIDDIDNSMVAQKKGGEVSATLVQPVDNEQKGD